MALTKSSPISTNSAAYHAAIPSLLYYLALFVQIDAYSARRGLRGALLPRLFFQDPPHGVGLRRRPLRAVRPESLVESEVSTPGS